MRKTVFLGGAFTAGIAVLFWLAVAPGTAQNAPPIDSDDIGGTVIGAEGPEASVWVIAETKNLPTKYAKIVVTDDQGRFVIPDLPPASYSVWVRGYGLVDSAKVAATPGKMLSLKAVAAPSEAAAAHYYPALYWYAMLGIPAESEFPGTGPQGNGMDPKMKSQGQWLDVVKTDGCYTCHQLGDAATRLYLPALGKFKTSRDAWEHRIQVGQAGTSMIGSIGRVDTQRALALFGDWTDRVRKGELPFAKPPRPQGLERNIVVTLWDWHSPTAYLHDEAATDKRNPRINAGGPLYGSPEESTDFVPVLDPVRNIATSIKAPARDKDTPTTRDNVIAAPSPYWGAGPVWDSKTNIHNPMFDDKGRVWLTSRIRANDTPAFCRAGPSHPSAKAFPTQTTGRNLAMYDPATKKFSLIDTCYSTHHLNFAYDGDNTLWTSGGGDVVGWLNTKMYLATGDEQKSQGWTALIVDTNGDGKRGAYTEPGQPQDPTKDMRVRAGFYAVAIDPNDNAVWGSFIGYPGGVVRLVPGKNPPETALAEIFYVPFEDAHAPIKGYSPRGLDIDRHGVVWMPLASGQFASFDRRKCTGPLNGPKATGNHCPEGWTLYTFPGPQFKNVSSPGSAEASYYAWVDQHDTFGLGNDIPIATGNASDALLALKDGKFVTLRVPYPMGFYAKGLDGRIDDPGKGWKGKGLWSTYATRTPITWRAARVRPARSCTSSSGLIRWHGK
ncbi:MAG: carboxypeptidase regulatory-like domain-containing protein [Alphaproteobacteria bacterium]|nr:carboxypeptidase regulatory-like domain-containing protein [Alphaproteobacteria bacterium]